MILTRKEIRESKMTLEKGFTYGWKANDDSEGNWYYYTFDEEFTEVGHRLFAEVAKFPADKFGSVSVTLVHKIVTEEFPCRWHYAQ